MAPGAGLAQQTRAGRIVENIAAAAWTVEGQSKAARSNADRRRIDERLDLTLTAIAEPVRAIDGTLIGRAILTNTGNGQEPFFLGGTAVEAARIILVAIDTDGDGMLGPADTRIDAGTPVLAPGAALALLLVFRPDPGAAAVRATLSAQAATGSGIAGTLFRARGDDGVDAVVGMTRATATIAFAIADPGAPTLSKTQAVRAPDGSSRAIRGAWVTYVLRADFPSGVRAARIDDPVPAGTRLVPGSVRLDGAVLAHPPDAAGIHAALGPVAAGGVHILEFQVVIE